jgi:catalase
MAKKTPSPSPSPRKAPAAARTDSGPATSGAPAGADPNSPAARQAEEAEALAAAMPFNPTKVAEHGFDNGRSPPEGATVEPPSRLPTASTLSEAEGNDKTGSIAIEGLNATIDSLDRVRVDSGGRPLTTNQGVQVGDNQNSLKDGPRGPVLLEDFILREKITHFDHERIPERIVHARGSAAHGYFECYEPLADLTRAAPFQAAGKRTPVFVRFSTVQGERGSKDTARDVRGFAVKFYTDEGNWDLVGNNIPVFFIQDAMKFPDLVHAVKPEPHHQMPQAASAHDTFWDFVSLMPESTHMLMWVMSDRAIPRSFATMQGFGVHTFRLVDADGESVFCKFHWSPVAGTHSLVWDEAVKISGADPDFHRRDLWERIENGAFPEYELSVQVFTEEQAEGFSFDILDATKIVPEELVPLRPVGRMVLNRNPDNFFAETEQVAFCTANIIPGIDFSNDPLLAGRIHSYHDTQLSRLGGPNFHEIPINAPIVQVHNNQRDGLHRQAIHRGRVSYEPNSLAGGCPFQAGAAQGFVSVPARQRAKDEQAKVRAKPEKFADHYTQARLFFESQTPAEQAHIAAAFRFELSKVTVPAIRRRMVASLRNASEALAAQVGRQLGMDPLPDPLPRAIDQPARPEVDRSPPLSLMSRPGDGSVKGRKVAIFVAPGSDAASVDAVRSVLAAQGAAVRVLGPQVGPQASTNGAPLEADASFENEPAFLFDAVAVAHGEAAVQAMAADANALDGLRSIYRHCKPLLAIGSGATVLQRAGVPVDDTDPALIVVGREEAERGATAFAKAIGMPRYFDRETDPPRV